MKVDKLKSKEFDTSQYKEECNNDTKWCNVQNRQEGISTRDYGEYVQR